MSDIKPTPQGLTASRRAVLKGAVGAGIGLAAWSAPRIGSIPAYALTNSSGIFNGEIYYIAFNSENGQGNQKYVEGTSTSPSLDAGRATSMKGGSGNAHLATYTWAGAFPDGSDLVVTAVGNPITGIGTITLVTAPEGCGFEILSPTTGSVNSGDYTVTGNTWSLSGTSNSGTYTKISATEIHFEDVLIDSQLHYLHFNIVCN